MQVWTVPFANLTRILEVSASILLLNTFLV